MTLLKRRAQVALELETTEGTQETLVDADAGLVVYDVEFTPDIQTTPRNPLRSTLSNLPHFVGRKQAQIRFRTEIVGGGTAGDAAPFSKALQACGYGETIVPATSATYKPDSTITEGDGYSATVGVYIDGKRFLIYGARGTAVLTFRAGEPAFIEFTFTGVYGGVSDTALLSPTYETTTPPVFLGATLTLGGDTLIAEEVSIDLGNTVAMRPDVTQATGFKSAVITARDPSGSIDPEDALVATRDDWAQLANGTAKAFNLVLGSVAGNTITISAPEAMLTSVGQGDRDGVLTNALSVVFTTDTIAGEDEISIAFT